MQNTYELIEVVSFVIKSLLEDYITELCSTCSDLKAVYNERFNRKLAHIINKSMFINGDGNWVSLLSDAFGTCNNYKHNNKYDSCWCIT